MPGTPEELLQMNLHDKHWRLNNLYKIKDKTGKAIPFYRTLPQLKLYNLLQEKRRLILVKARQIGFSTAIGMYMLDEMLWNKDISIATVADTAENSKRLFKRNIRDTYEYFAEEFPELLPGAEVVTENSNEMRLQNGSSIYTGTRLRSGTYQFLHASEAGIVAFRDPVKYDELLMGAFNTVPTEGTIVVETTVLGGRSTAFYDLCKTALDNMAQGRTGPNDWYLHFVPWYVQDEYSLNDNTAITDRFKKYFNKLRDDHDIKMFNIFSKEIANKKKWYINKFSTLGEKIYSEFPSTIDEAFYVSAEGSIYGTYLLDATLNNQICKINYDANLPLYVTMDIGLRDKTCIIWYQITNSGNIHIIDYYEDNNKLTQYYIDLLKDKYNRYSEIFLPHDSKKVDMNSGLSAYNTFIKHFNNVSAIPMTKDKWDGINAARGAFSKTFFDSEKCKPLIQHLSNYQKRYNTAMGCYIDEPLHNDASHAADAYRYVFEAIETQRVVGGPVARRSRRPNITNSTGRTF